jgi:hypothetical protein
VLTDKGLFLGSANLTQQGFAVRDELACLIFEDVVVGEANKWYESLWTSSEDIDLSFLDETMMTEKIPAVSRSSAEFDKQIPGRGLGWLEKDFSFPNILQQIAKTEIKELHYLQFYRKGDKANSKLYHLSIDGREVSLKRRDEPSAIVLHWKRHDHFFIEALTKSPVVRLGPKKDKKNIFSKVLRKHGFDTVGVKGRDGFETGGNHKDYFLFQFGREFLNDPLFIRAVEKSVCAIFDE